MNILFEYINIFWSKIFILNPYESLACPFKSVPIHQRSPLIDRHTYQPVYYQH